jgi:hypothetical protein
MTPTMALRTALAEADVIHELVLVAEPEGRHAAAHIARRAPRALRRQPDTPSTLTTEQLADRDDRAAQTVMARWPSLRVTRRLDPHLTAPCPACDGGTLVPEHDHITRCPTCLGRGWVEED